MREFEIDKGLKRILKKLYKKDRKRYEIVYSKIDEILKTEYVEHYKNLRSPLNDFKRVHIDSSFVLVFKYSKSEDKVIFYNLDHHDKIYSKRS